ncbi:TLC domain-containing protein [Xylariaceae sp. FL1019]|nr:TLC domain-containing protein [Xylariaceae sp. FL1019]
MASSEPFPLLSTPADQMRSVAEQNTARRRRKSSLPVEIRAGDTGAPSLQTSLETIQSSSSTSSRSGAVDAAKKGSKRRKARSALRRFKHFSLRHTWVLPLIILSLVAIAYAVNPTESNPVHRFIFLSYRMPPHPDADPDTPAQYGKGPWDIAFFSFYTVVLSFTREFIMQEFLRPLSRAAGLKSRGKQARFMEQAYTAIYFGFLGPAGLYVMKQTPIWYFNTRAFYEDFPHKTHVASFKFYYLFQAAYWAQQAVVLLIGLEKPRKDYKELVGHHIVSLALIALSYRFHFTYLGIAVYITHDISDFFLATSKVLNYIDHWLVGPYFFVFMCVWTYLRHFLNLSFIWSLFTEFKTVGPYELNWETEQYKCDIAFVITFALLASLQALNLFWMFFIVRIAYRFVVYQTADDDRSEAEESELEEMEREKKAKEAKALLNGQTTGANAQAKRRRNS